MFFVKTSSQLKLPKQGFWSSTTDSSTATPGAKSQVSTSPAKLVKTRLLAVTTHWTESANFTILKASH